MGQLNVRLNTQTFSTMKEISMKEYDEEGYDPGHLNQHRWDD